MTQHIMQNETHAEYNKYRR